MIEEVTSPCTRCKEYSSPPFGFRASIPNNEIVFNHELEIDFLWLKENPVIHVAYTHTNFQNANILRDKSAEGLWDAFVTFWYPVYLGYTNILRLDEEASFAANMFKNEQKCMVLNQNFQASNHIIPLVPENDFTPHCDVYLT